MKKLIGVVIFLLIFIVAGLGVLKFLKKDAVAIESVLPHEPYSYVHFKDVGQNLKILTSTQIWQTISQLDYDRLFDQSSLSSQQRKMMGTVFDQITNPTNSMIINKLFGNEFAIAVYEPQIDLDQLKGASIIQAMNVMEKVLSSVFIVTRVSKDVQVAEVFAGTFKNFGNNLKQKTIEYEGLKIHILSEPNTGLNVSYARIKDLLILGISDKAVKTVWDVANNKVEPLSVDPQFKRAVEKSVSSPAVIGFWNIQKLFDKFEKSADQTAMLSRADNQNSQSQINEVLEHFKGFESVGFSSEIGKTIAAKFNLFFNKKSMSGDAANFYSSCVSQKNETLQMVPIDVLGYQWTNCFGLEYYWKEIKRGLERQAQLEGKEVTTVIGELEEKIGLRIEEDILAAVGDEIGGYLQDINSGGIIPFPKLVVFLEVKDRAKMDALIERLTASPFVRFNQESYKEIPLQVMAMALGGDFQPSYCYLGDYLLIAINRKLLNQSIDTFKSGAASIKENENFKSIDFGLSDKNSSLHYIGLSSFIDKFSNVIKWSDKWIGAKQMQRQAFHAGRKNRMEDVIKEIKESQYRLELKEDQRMLLKEEVERYMESGLDVAEKEKVLVQLTAEVAQLKVNIASGEEQRLELEEIVGGYEKKMPNSEKRKLYLEEVIFPLLESFRSIKAVGSKVVVGDSVMETSIYMELF